MKQKSSPSDKKSLRPWQVLDSREVFVAEPWIRLSVEKVRLPDGRVIDDYFRFDLTDCVIVFAETKDGKVVMERLYKHGVRKVTLMLPTGGIEKGETPFEAAQREFKEETGYMAEDWQCLGHFVYMGNYGGCKAHLFRARHAYQVVKPQPTDLEDIEIVLLDLKELMEGIREGTVSVLNTITAVLLATHPLYTPQEGHCVPKGPSSRNVSSSRSKKGTISQVSNV